MKLEISKLIKFYNPWSFTFVGCKDFGEIIEKCQEWFLKIKCTFQEFSSLIFESKMDIAEHFQKKLDMGGKLGFSNAIILEGLPSQMKTYMTSKDINIPIDWLQTAIKLVKYTLRPYGQPETYNNRQLRSMMLQMRLATSNSRGRFPSPSCRPAQPKEFGPRDSTPRSHYQERLPTNSSVFYFFFTISCVLLNLVRSCSYDSD